MRLFIIGGQPHSMINMLYRRDHLALNLLWLGRFPDVKYVYFKNGPLSQIGLVHTERRANGIEYIRVNDSRFLLANYLSFIAVFCLLIAGIRVQRTDVALFTLPRFTAFRSLFAKGHVYYDRSDNWPGQYSSATITQRIKRTLVNRRERQLFKASAAITTSSTIMANMLKKKLGNQANVHYLPHGYTPDETPESVDMFCDQAPEFLHLSLVASLTSKDHIKVDFDLILEILRTSKRLFLHICGPLEDSPGPVIQAILDHPRVRYHGVLASSEVKAFIERSELGLIPYKINEFTLGVLPIKLLDYVSASRPVCMTRLPSVEEDPQFSSWCHFIDGFEKLEDELDSLLKSTETATALAFCREHLTWEQSVKRMQTDVFANLSNGDKA